MTMTQELPPLAYTYAWGYKSRAAAHMAFLALCAEGECSQSELFAFEPYTAGDGSRLWKICLCAN